MKLTVVLRHGSFEFQKLPLATNWAPLDKPPMHQLLFTCYKLYFYIRPANGLQLQRGCLALS